MIRIIIFAFSLFILAACKSGHKNNESETTAPTAQIVTEKGDSAIVAIPVYWGTYRGVIPATGNDKVRITLILNKDYTFRMITDQTGEKRHHHTYTGDFSISDSIVTIQIKNEMPKYFKVESNKLIMLDSDKRKVDDSHPEMYVLKLLSR